MEQEKKKEEKRNNALVQEFYDLGPSTSGSQEEPVQASNVKVNNSKSRFLLFLSKRTADVGPSGSNEGPSTSNEKSM